MAMMRQHLTDHCSGKFLGSVPQTFLDHENLTQCSVCSRLVSTRYGTCCPSCRSTLVRRDAATSGSVPGARPHDRLPLLRDMLKNRTSTKQQVAKGAKRLWAQRLVQALAAVVANNDEFSWHELFALPLCVLRASDRGGAGRRRGEVESKSACRKA